MNEVKRPTINRGVADTFGRFVDRCVYAFSPERGVRRMAMRRAHDAYQERYGDHPRNSAHDAAKTDTTRGSSWMGSRLSPDSAIEQDLVTMRQRARELYRSDSIGGAVDSRANLVVSYGFTPQACIKAKPGLATDAQAEKWNDELEECYARLHRKIGKTGKHSLWQELRLVARHHGIDGESITILSDRGGTDKPVPLTLEVIDPERLETPPSMIGNPLCRMGVEHDASGMIVAYHIRDTHPGDSLSISQKSTRYPADRVLHVFERWFAGQSRGYPWLVRMLNRAKDAKDLDEAAIIAAQVQACMAAFIVSPLGPSRAATAAASGSTDGSRYEDIRPGTIRYGDPGEDVRFTTPPNGGPNYQQFHEVNARRMAAGMNYPYEMLAKNWSGTSFAGGRLALAEARLMVEGDQELLDEAWLSEVWNRMTVEAVIVGAVSIPPTLFQRDPWWYQQHIWIAPAWPFALTPVEEVKAKSEAVKANFITKTRVIGEFGGSRDDVFRTRAEEVEAEETLGITPPDVAESLATMDQTLQDQLERAGVAR